MLRARREEDKQARREAIMRAAIELLDERRFPDVKMSDVARAASLAKGTVFLYFPTKEALFLDVLEDLLIEWLAEVNQALDTGKGRWTSARVARLITDTLVQRNSLTRLFTLMGSVLEQNVEVERVIAFKTRLLELLADTGARLERRLEFLAPGSGAHLLMRIYAVVVGVRQWTDPGEVARQALARPELGVLAFDFEVELRTLLLAMLRGFEIEVAEARSGD